MVSDKSKSSLTITAQLLGLNEEELKRSLTSRVMITSKGGTVGTIIKLVLHTYSNYYCMGQIFDGKILMDLIHCGKSINR